MSKRVLNSLKMIYLRFWKTVVESYTNQVTIIKFRVNNRCGNDTGNFEFKGGVDTTKCTNMIIARFGEYRDLVRENEVIILKMKQRLQLSQWY